MSIVRYGYFLFALLLTQIAFATTPSSEVTLDKSQVVLGEKITSLPPVIGYNFSLKANGDELQNASVTLIAGHPATFTLSNDNGTPRTRVVLTAQLSKQKLSAGTETEVATIEHVIQSYNSGNWAEIASPQIFFVDGKLATFSLGQENAPLTVSIQGYVNRTTATAADTTVAMQMNCAKPTNATDSLKSGGNCCGGRCNGIPWTCCGGVACCNCGSCCVIP